MSYGQHMEPVAHHHATTEPHLALDEHDRRHFVSLTYSYNVITLDILQYLSIIQIDFPGALQQVSLSSFNIVGLTLSIVSILE